jgi:hypothetical protein
MEAPIQQELKHAVTGERSVLIELHFPGIGIMEIDLKTPDLFVVWLGSVI